MSEEDVTDENASYSPLKHDDVAKASAFDDIVSQIVNYRKYDTIFVKEMLYTNNTIHEAIYAVRCNGPFDRVMSVLEDLLNYLEQDDPLFCIYVRVHDPSDGVLCDVTFIVLRMIRESGENSDLHFYGQMGIMRSLGLNECKLFLSFSLQKQLYARYSTRKEGSLNGCGYTFAQFTVDILHVFERLFPLELPDPVVSSISHDRLGSRSEEYRVETNEEVEEQKTKDNDRVGGEEEEVSQKNEREELKPKGNERKSGKVAGNGRGTQKRK